MDLMGNCKLMVEAQDKHIGKINKENQTYFSAITMFKGEIKDFENLLEEFRSIHDRDFLQHNKKLVDSLHDYENKLQEMVVDKNQMRAMLRNQNFHFTEMQKSIACSLVKVEELNVRTEPLESLGKQVQATDKYLKYYAPVLNYKLIHEALCQVTKSLKTEQQRDLFSHSQKNIDKWLLEIEKIDTEEETPFKKDNLGNRNWMQIDSKVAELRWQFDTEEDERKAEEKEQEAIKLARVPSEFKFRDRLYEAANLRKLSNYMGAELEPTFAKVTAENIKTNPDIAKLLDAYANDFDDGSIEGEDEEEEEEEESEDEEEEESEEESEEEVITPKRKATSKVKPTVKKRAKKQDSSSESESQSPRSASSPASSRSHSSALQTNETPNVSVMKNLKPKKEKKKKKAVSVKSSSSASSSASEVKRIPKKLKNISNYTSKNSDSGRSRSSSERSIKRMGENFRLDKVKKHRKPSHSSKSSEQSERSQSVRSDDTREIKKANDKKKKKDGDFKDKLKVSTKKRGFVEKIEKELSQKTLPLASNTSKVNSLAANSSKPLSKKKVSDSEESEEESKDKIDEADHKIEDMLKPKSVETAKVKETKKKEKVRESTDKEGTEKKVKVKKGKTKKKLLEDTGSVGTTETGEEKQPKVKKGKTKRKLVEDDGKPTKQDKLIGKVGKATEMNLKRIQKVVRTASNLKQEIEALKEASFAQQNSSFMPGESIPEEGEDFCEDGADDAARDSILGDETPDGDGHKNRDGSVSLSPDPMLTPGENQKLRPPPSKQETGNFGGKKVIKKKGGTTEPEVVQVKATRASVKNRLTPGQIPSSGATTVASAPTPTPTATVPLGKNGKALKGKAAAAFAKAEAMKNRPIGYGVGGGAVTKAIFVEMTRVLKDYAKDEPFQECQAETSRCLSVVSLFKIQQEIFKKQFETQLATNEAQAQQAKANAMIQEAIQPRANPNDSGVRNSPLDSSKSQNRSFGAQSDGTSKQILLAVQGTMNTLMKKVTILEGNAARKQDEKLPFDIARLSNTEVNTRRDIAIVLETVNSHKEQLESELKRLRREHLANIKTIETCKSLFDANSNKIGGIVERQSLNDMAMATMFKVLKINYSLEEQDEKDKRETYLMGKVESGEQRNTNNISRIDGGNSKFLGEPSINFNDESIISSRSNRQQTSPGTAAPRHQRASTRIPLDVCFKHDRNAPNPTLTIDKNCLTCNQSAHNEAIMKAFKMACLTYEPSNVTFENQVYSRDQLIEAKFGLIQFCLGQLKHLDLGSLYQKKYAEQLEQSLSQGGNSSQGKRTAANTDQMAPLVDYSSIDPRDLPQFPASAKHGSAHQNAWMQMQSQEGLKYAPMGGTQYGAFDHSKMSQPINQSDPMNSTRYGSYAKTKRATLAGIQGKKGSMPGGGNRRIKPISVVGMSEGSRDGIMSAQQSMDGYGRVPPLLDMNQHDQFGNLMSPTVQGTPAVFSQHSSRRGQPGMNQQQMMEMSMSGPGPLNHQMMAGYGMNMPSPSQQWQGGPMINYSSSGGGPHHSGGFNHAQQMAMQQQQQQHLRHNLRLPSLKEDTKVSGASLKDKSQSLTVDQVDSNCNSSGSNVLAQKKSIQLDFNHMPETNLASQTIENESNVNGSMYTKAISESQMDHAGSSNKDIQSSLSKSRHNMSARNDPDAGITNPAPMPHNEVDSNTSPDVSMNPNTIDFEDKM